MVEVGNETRQGRKYSKIRPMSCSLLNSFAGDSRPLATKNNQEKCHGHAGKYFISALRSTPSHNDASS